MNGFRRGAIKVLLLLFALPFLAPSFAFTEEDPSSRIILVDNVTGECAIAGMTDKQAIRFAVWQARAKAVEQAVGVRVSAYSLVKDGTSVIDYIKSAANGVIVWESEHKWDPVTYQPDLGKPWIMGHRVTLSMKVRPLGNRRGPALGLTAELNQSPPQYRAGEKASIRLKTRRNSRIAIFNIMADDRVVRLFPNSKSSSLDKDIVQGGCPTDFPCKDSPVELILDNLPGHSEDVESVIVIAIAPEEGEKLERLTPSDDPIPVMDFFSRYAEIVDRVEDVTLPYRVVGKGADSGR